MSRKIKNLIGDYLEDSKIFKTEGTYEYESVKLNYFFKFINSAGIIYEEEVTKEIINDFFFELKKTNCASSVNKYIKLLKLFFRKSNINFLYIHTLKNLPETRKETPTIDFKTLEEITEYIDNMDDDYGNNLLHKLIIFLLVDTAVRPAELLMIEKKLIDFERKDIVLAHTKANGERTVHINDFTLKYIKKFMKKKGNTSKFLLYNHLRNRPANVTDLVQAMNKIKKKFEANRMFAYLFRHTIATYWYHHEKDIYFVKKLLGHSNISQTVRYIHADKKLQKETYEKVSFKIKSKKEEDKITVKAKKNSKAKRKVTKIEKSKTK